MEKAVKKFLRFNGKNVYFISVEGIWWIAVKPICQALRVDYERQRRNIQEDEILGQLPSMQTVVAGDGRLRKMLCLPEEFIYGWIFQVQSDSPDLKKYKYECFRVLHQHFYGTLTERYKKAKAETEAERVEREKLSLLKQSPLYTEWQEAHNMTLKVRADLRKYDRAVVQATLFPELN